MPLTKKERINILAQYWGQSGIIEHFYGHNEEEISDETIGRDIKLCLNDIDDISDEHCVEVGKIFGHVEDRDYNTKLYVIMRVKKLLSGVDKHSPNSSISVWSEVVDYLRENGYAVPYKGQSLFDLGVAVKKSEYA